VQITEKNIGRYLEWWHSERHKARTDLVWLSNTILGYPDVSERVHGPILEALQKFPGAVEFHKTVADYQAAMQGKVLWEPKCKMELLPPNDGFEQSRDNLILFPRGHIKTTIVSVAHSIQWVLNYPNVRILGTTATETLITSIVLEIRNHFILNDQLRLLFPELCPQAKDGKIPEFGNLSGFTCPARDNNNKKLGPGGKEPTFLATTVGSAITGYHGDVQKTDDAVEKINSSSQTGIDEVIRHAGSMGDLLEKYNSDDPEKPLAGWVDMVGTPWDFSDLYQVRRNHHADQITKGLPPPFNLIVRSAAPNWPNGPFLWPERMGYVALKKIEDDPEKGPAQLSAQYLMNPIVAGQGLIDDVKQLIWTPEKVMDQLLPRMSLYAALDVAGMEDVKGHDSDFTVLTVGGFANARLYVPFMLYGRPPVEEVIEWIFQVFDMFPGIVKLKIQKQALERVLLATLRREMSKRGRFLPIQAEPADNQQSKKSKIRGLRPWFQAGNIRFSDSLPYRTAIETEIKGFPKYRHDDILDTLTDLMLEGKSVNAGVLSNRVDEYVPPSTFRDPISLLLAEHYQDEDAFYPKVNPLTGFPA
jgi:predicted phage terminase large subunit-like protein